MEFLRFGSSIPGSYWGCCAMDIIQNFNYDPDAKASIQLVDGDGGNPLTNDKGFMFAGPTYKDIFLQRLRYGTFSSRRMPNHGFLAILTSSQVNSSTGQKWLKLLKENGFEFIRTVDNSVYSGATMITEPGEKTTSAHPNYLFGLFRNVGFGAMANPYVPPKAWTDLPEVVPEAWTFISDGVELNKRLQKAHLPIYKGLPEGKFFSEEELEKDSVPITYAGTRSKLPQQLKSVRLSTVEALNKAQPAGGSAPWTATLPSMDAGDLDDDEGDWDCPEEDYYEFDDEMAV